MVLNHRSFSDAIASRVSWGDLTHLTSIDLRNCSLDTIPIGIANLDPNILTSLRLEGNPLIDFHQTLVESKASARVIIETLRESLQGGEMALKETKVMILGLGVGRSFTLKALFRDKLQTFPSQNMIDLVELNVDGHRLMFYDFAGQAIYRNAHYLFLSDYTIFIVMFLLSKTEEEANYDVTLCMDSVLQRAPDACYLLVGNFASSVPDGEVNLRMKRHLERMQRQYGRCVVGAIAIDSMKNSGISQLRQELVRLAARKVKQFWLDF